jgi:hypothetical protein
MLDGRHTSLPYYLDLQHHGGYGGVLITRLYDISLGYGVSNG